MRATVDPRHLSLPLFLAAPRRFMHEIWQGFVAMVQYIQAMPEMAATIEDRASGSRGSGIEVYTECSCGACQIVSTFGGPRFTATCNCIECRDHGSSHRSEALSFAAVKRASCRLEVDESTVEHDMYSQQPACLPDARSSASVGAFVWTDSSVLGRRACCRACGTPLAMDYEYLEPNTLWLANPKVRVVRRTVQETLALRRYLARIQKGNGNLDGDFCWASQYLAAEGSTGNQHQKLNAASRHPTGGSLETSRAVNVVKLRDTKSELAPKDAKACEDINWNSCYVDSGRL